jgi:hypothetical protein
MTMEPVRAELLLRSPRPPDHEGETRALAALATEMAENPRKREADTLGIVELSAGFSEA